MAGLPNCASHLRLGTVTNSSLCFVFVLTFFRLVFQTYFEYLASVFSPFSGASQPHTGFRAVFVWSSLSADWVSIGCSFQSCTLWAELGGNGRTTRFVTLGDFFPRLGTLWGPLLRRAKNACQAVSGPNLVSRVFSMLHARVSAKKNRYKRTSPSRTSA